MNIKSVGCLFFSPTGTTRKIVESIAEGMRCEQIELMDFTKRSQRKNGSFDFSHDLIIIAAPVYYGRVPEEIVPFLKSLKVRDKPAVIVVVYGNREYDDALLELHDISMSQGFCPVAGGAFVAEHSYSSSALPIAPARPDTDDIRMAQLFGTKVMDKLKAVDADDSLPMITVPGNFPYKEPENLQMLKQARKTLSFTPETDLDKCIQCGLCVEVCPTEAIDRADVSVIDRWQCIICFACIKNCPSGAKQMVEPHFIGAVERLQVICQLKREPEIYL
ncbi:EFR1 family ferrodoxin [Desulfomarina sp.]